MAKLVDGIHPFDLPLACGQSKSNVAQAQVSSSRRHNRIRHPSRKRLKRGWNGWAVTAIALAVWLWNWKLLIATASGISATLLVYTAQQWHWQRLRAKLDQLLEGNNRQLAIAAVSGGGALIATYAAISLWVSLENHWLAATLIAQGLAIGTVLMFQIEQWLKRHEAKGKGDVLQELQKVADADPLKRIVAVRQLSCWLLQAPLDAGEEQAISDAFRLLLKQEQEAIVKDAALEGLQLLETLHPLKGSHKVSLLEEEML